MVVVTNLNRRLKTPADKAVQEGKPIAKFITGPTRSVQDFQAPDPFLGKFKTNPRSDSFYQMLQILKYLKQILIIKLVSTVILLKVKTT